MSPVSVRALCAGCDLFRLESRWDPGVLLRGTARVVVRDGVSLEVGDQLRHHLLQLARHRTHGMLLSHTLAVHTDLPVETGTGLKTSLLGQYKLIRRQTSTETKYHISRSFWFWY